MTVKGRVKIVVDLVMIILMPLQMAYSITGEASHRITGMILCIIVILHNVLNLQWYKNLFSGKYTASRIFQTVINFGTIICFLGLIVSGIMMSTTLYSLGFVFPNNFARLCHLRCSYWGFVFMSLHLGLHWKIFMGMIKNKNSRITIIARILGYIIVVIGIYAFIKTNVWQYMFGIAHYLILKYTPPAQFFAEYIAMMGLWVFIGHYGLKLMVRKNRVKSENM
jgi:hypothetical protein